MLRALVVVALLALFPAPVAAIVCTGTGPCTVTVRSSGGDYPTLNAALAGESADLVTAARLLTIECYEFTDTTTATTGTGYTTSADYYINIVVPVAERHDGTPNAGGYLLSGSGSPLLTIAGAYTRVTGLHVVSTGSHGVYVSGGNVLIDKCLVKGTGRNGLSTDSSSANGLVVQNTLAYRCGRAGFEISAATVAFKNCTAAECARNGFGRVTSGTVTATNCLAYSNGDGVTYFDFLGTMTANYNASTDATADDNGGTGNRVSQTFAFVNAAGNDFHLASNDAEARDYGTSTSMPTDDIDGEDRTGGTWDIGFDEYPEAGAPAVAPSIWIQSNEVIQ